MMIMTTDEDDKISQKLEVQKMDIVKEIFEKEVEPGVVERAVLTERLEAVCGHPRVVRRVEIWRVDKNKNEARFEGEAEV